jgi:hypothetical protein
VYERLSMDVWPGCLIGVLMGRRFSYGRMYKQDAKAGTTSM